MLSGIVSFVNTEVQEIMKPRVDITAVAITDSYEQVKQTIIRSGFSRIPVYEGDLDNIKGTLYVKDLLSHIDRGDEFGWQQLIRRPYFVPEHKKINDLLADFQSNKIHMAIVVDEYGSTLGLVSLEDIIEEIVGEISDESDNDESFYTRLDAKSYLSTARPTWAISSGFSSSTRIPLPMSGARPRRSRADARTQARLPAQGRHLHVARYPFHGAGGRRHRSTRSGSMCHETFC